jgi:hypothetical protein
LIIKLDFKIEVWILRGLLIGAIQSIVLLFLISASPISAPTIAQVIFNVYLADALSVYVVGIFWGLASVISKRFRLGHRIPRTAASIMKILFLALPFSIIATNFIVNLNTSYIPVEHSLIQMIIALATIIALGITYLLVQEEHGRMLSRGWNWFVNLRLIRIAFWVPLGGLSGFLFGLSIIAFWNRMGISDMLQNNEWLIIATSVVVLAAINLLSVLAVSGSKSSYNLQIDSYSRVVELLGNTESFFINQYSTQDQPYAITMDYKTVREEIDKILPWVVLCISSATVIWSTFIPDWINNQTVDLSDLSLSLFFSLILLLPILSIERTYSKHKKWKKIWLDYWITMHYLSISDTQLAFEYTFSINANDWNDAYHALATEEMIENTKLILEDYQINDSIQSDSSEVLSHYINAMNYDICRKKIDEFKKKQSELHTHTLIETAKNLIGNLSTLLGHEPRKSIARAHFYLSKYENLFLFPEMIQDFGSLIVESQEGITSVEELSGSMIRDMTTSEESVVPSSIRRIVTIYPVALWFAAIMLILLEFI